MKWEIDSSKIIYQTPNLQFIATRLVGKKYRGFWANALKFRTDIKYKYGNIPIQQIGGDVFFNFLKLFLGKVKRATSRTKSTHFQLNIEFDDLERR